MLESEINGETEITGEITKIMLESEITGETEISLIMLEDRDKWRDRDISDYVRRQR